MMKCFRTNDSWKLSKLKSQGSSWTTHHLQEQTWYCRWDVKKTNQTPDWMFHFWVDCIRMSRQSEGLAACGNSWRTEPLLFKNDGLQRPSRKKSFVWTFPLYLESFSSKVLSFFLLLEDPKLFVEPQVSETKAGDAYGHLDQEVQLFAQNNSTLCVHGVCAPNSAVHTGSRFLARTWSRCGQQCQFEAVFFHLAISFQIDQGKCGWEILNLLPASKVFFCNAEGFQDPLEALGCPWGSNLHRYHACFEFL